MHVGWDTLQLVLAIAESGSLSAAAARLRITQPTASRRLAELERQLGEKLFERHVGGARLTAFGEHLLHPARRMAEWAGEAERVMLGASGAPKGAVRITAPPGVAADWLVPFAAQLRAQLPEIELEVLARVEYLDLGRREADLALRMQPPTDRDLRVLAKVEAEVGVFASPAYAATLPCPVELAQIRFVGWTPNLEHLSPNPQLRRLIEGFRPSFSADDYLLQTHAALAGLGAMVFARVAHEWGSMVERLVELEVELPRVSSGIWLTCAPSALDLPRVRVVAERLAQMIERARLLPTRSRPASVAAPRRARRAPAKA